MNVKLLQKLYKVLNSENKDFKPQNSQFYRFYIGKGNNYYAVRSIIKRRAHFHKGKVEKFVDCEQLEEDDETAGAHFVWTAWRKPELTEELQKNQDRVRVYNRLDCNFHLSNKKALFVNMNNYYNALGMDPFQVAIPLTFHIKSGANDPEYLKFLDYYNRYEQTNENQNIWIIKPGENTNRGVGIQVAQALPEIRQIINSLS